jgi:hypothetical protein
MRGRREEEEREREKKKTDVPKSIRLILLQNGCEHIKVSLLADVLQHIRRRVKHLAQNRKK